MIRFALPASACLLALITAGLSPRGAGLATRRAPLTAPQEQMHEHAVQDSAKRAEAARDAAHELEELRARIAGREKEPATQVFKNIQLFKDMEAGRLPMVMGSWCRALGVTCKHCHVVDQWEKEDRPEKQIARDMSAMVMEINTNLLKKIKNLDSPEPRIGCWTCHRGSIIPEFFPPRERREGAESHFSPREKKD